MSTDTRTPHTARRIETMSNATIGTDTRTLHGVGLTTRDGRFEVVSCEWDHNGSYRVVVHDHAGAFRTSRTERRARDLARRVDPMGKIQWTRLDDVRMTGDDEFRLRYYFTASRLDAQYK